MLLVKYLLNTFLLIAITISATAQSFRYTQYTTHNGLPIDNVYAAAQDDNGYIWFATDFGISKYDGYRFENFNRENKIATKAITDIVYAGGDSCIFLSYPNTIQSIHSNGKINTIGVVTQFALHQIIKHQNDYYFYQRNKNRVGILHNGKIQLHQVDSVLNTVGIILHSIASLGNRGIAYCTNQGLFISNNGAIVKFLNREDVYFAIAKKDEQLIAVSNSAIKELDNTGLLKKEMPLPNAAIIYNMVIDNDNTVWLRGIDKGIYRWKDDKLEEMSVQLGLQNKVVNEFFIDKENSTWMCTDGAGVLFKKKNNFTNYETQDGLANNKVLRFLKSNNNLFIGTDNGISVKNGLQIKPLQLPQTRIGLQHVYKFFQSEGNDVGVSITNTFANDISDELKKGLVEPKRIGIYKIGYTSSIAAWQQSTNIYWLATASEILKQENNKVVATYDLHKFGARKAYDIIQFDDKLFVGTSDGLIILENEKLLYSNAILGQKLGEVFQFLIDKKQHQLWIATENGLVVYKNKSYQFLPKGISSASNYCHSITQDNESKIWCATWDGIFVTDGTSRTTFSTNNGIASKTCNTILYDSTTNELYIGTDNGLSVINKERLTNNVAFSKAFIDCKINDTLNVLNKTILAASQNNLNFYFNVPYYMGSDEIKYEYKLDNNNWTEAKTPLVSLSDIGGGNHTLLVRASINNTVITKEDAVFSFTIKKRFYQTWWFWVLTAILLQFGIVKAINNYNRKNRNRKLVQQQLQAELATVKQQAFTSLMNPHFIFNALNSIQHYINKQDRQTANKYLSDFATLIRRSFDSAQKSFVSLDEELETARLYLQLEKMRFGDKFNYTITLNKEAEDEEWMLPGMVLQPFLENAILHGIAPLPANGQLTIDIKAANEILYIHITDNGVGIEKSRLYRKDKKHTSRGMQLIKERLQILSKECKQPIKLSITEHQPNTEYPGTAINIEIPQEVYTNYVRKETNK